MTTDQLYQDNNQSEANSPVTLRDTTKSDTIPTANNIKGGREAIRVMTSTKRLLYTVDNKNLLMNDVN